MSFEQVERIIGAHLPSSDYQRRSWWSNSPRNSVITKAWLSAGYKSQDVSMTGHRVVFRRIILSIKTAATRFLFAGGV